MSVPDSSQAHVILLVEDNPGDARLIEEMLSDVGGRLFHLVRVERLSAGLERLAAGDIAAVLLDMGLPDSQGFETFDRVQRQAPHVPIILLTGEDDEDLPIRAVQQGGQDYLVKGQIDGRLLARTLRYGIERKRAAEALGESEQVQRLVLENVDEAIYLIEFEGANMLSGRVRFVSSRAEQILGLRPEEFQRDPDLWLSLVHPDDVPALRESTGAILSSRAPGVRQYRIRHKPTGEYRWMEDRVVPQLNAAGEVVGQFGVARDVTERVQAEATLREREAFYRALIEHSYDAISLMDAGGKRIYNSPSMARISGRAPEETIGRSFAEVLHPDDLPTAADLFAQLRQSPGLTLQTQVRIRHKDGSLRWVEATGTNLLGDPSVGAIVANYHDITERKQAEEQLRYQAALLESVNDAVVASDAQYRLTAWNAAAELLYGWKAEEVLGRNGLEIVHTEWPVVEAEEMRRTIAEMGRWRGEATQARKDGTRISVEVSSIVLRDESGQIAGYVSVNRDISERKRAEEERDEILEQLRAGRVRLQAVSQQLLDVEEAERRHIALELHDEVVQTLTGLRLLLQPPPGVPPETLATRLGEAQQIVEELVTRVEELSLDLRPAALDDMGLLPALLDHFERYTDRTGVRVACKHSGLQRRFAPQIEIAAYRIVQEALTNVARHAGVADATVRLWANAESLGVQVEDAGAGFDPAAPLPGGFTTGLSGMRERARLLGGDLALESAPGKGTHLTAEFPLDRPLDKRERLR